MKITKQILYIVVLSLGVFCGCSQETNEEPTITVTPGGIEGITDKGTIKTEKTTLLTESVINLNDTLGASLIPVLRLVDYSGFEANVTISFDLEVNSYDDERSWWGHTIPLINDSKDKTLFCVAVSDLRNHLRHSDDMVLYYKIPVYVNEGSNKYRYISDNYYEYIGKIYFEYDPNATENWGSYSDYMAVDYLYVTGEYNGWTFESSSKIPRFDSGNNDRNFKGLAVVEGQFKFYGSANWSINWGGFLTGDSDFRGILYYDGSSIQNLISGIYWVENAIQMDSYGYPMECKMWNVDHISMRNVKSGAEESIVFENSLKMPLQGRATLDEGDYTLYIDCIDWTASSKLDYTGIAINASTPILHIPAKGEYLVNLDIISFPYKIDFSPVE